LPVRDNGPAFLRITSKSCSRQEDGDNSFTPS